jgi:hypothetical protein
MEGINSLFCMTAIYLEILSSTGDWTAFLTARPSESSRSNWKYRINVPNEHDESNYVISVYVNSVSP